MSDEKIILRIDRTMSYCGACNRSCDPYEKSHTKKSGYDQHDGCGATYTHVTARCMYPGLDERIKEMRPDLELIESGSSIIWGGR